jgi:nicotinamide riboside kinase
LAQRLGTLWVPEYGRELWISKCGALTYEDMLDIGRIQAAREDALAEQASRWLICDTTALTTLGYSLATFDRADPALEKLAERRYDTILLCAPDFPFEQDGTRRDTDFRAWQHEWSRNMLERRHIAYTLLTGSLEQRIQQALSLLT